MISDNIKKLKIIITLLSVHLFFGCGYNTLVSSDEDTKSAWAEVENQYQRRSDLIPNLVNVVKGYAKHEKETLEAVIAARAKATSVTLDASQLGNAAAFNNFQAAQSGLGQALSRLMVVVEKYPDLKANSNFRDLQAQLEGTENRLTVARKRYIDSVNNYNKTVRRFPGNLTARMFNFSVKETFRIEEKAKEVPRVEF